MCFYTENFIYRCEIMYCTNFWGKYWCTSSLRLLLHRFVFVMFLPVAHSFRYCQMLVFSKTYMKLNAVMLSWRGGFPSTGCDTLLWTEELVM